MKIPTCIQCGEQYPALFMLKNEVWKQIADRNDILCFDCAQRRLGRLILMEDLMECGILKEIMLGVRIWQQSQNPKCEES